MHETVRDIGAILDALGVRRVIVHGYRRPRHTHHWIQLALYRALREASRQLGTFDVAWRDNRDALRASECEDTLFVANANVDRPDANLPLHPRAWYLVHDHAPGRLSLERYAPLVRAGRCVFFEVFRGRPADASWEPIADEPLHWVRADRTRAVLTWATDLLPAQIDANIDRVRRAPRSRPDARTVCFVGSVWRSNETELREVVAFCARHGLRFEQWGGYVARGRGERWPGEVVIHATDVSPEQNAQLVREALLAPAIQGRAQMPHCVDVGNYVPCRIFKNLSYGAWGVTNNATVQRLFDGRLVHDEQVPALLERALRFVRADPDPWHLVSLMEIVRDRHTYWHRLRTLLRVLRDRRRVCVGVEIGRFERGWLRARTVLDRAAYLATDAWRGR
ncbi:MAG: hypothetical protein NZ898_06615 [Myxococcota bacterium]|nr:hypothetical protein [Myxococcota bacterium]MDW8362425.1 hypothetical protein [Myxococcales bacterium]